MQILLVLGGQFRGHPDPPQPPRRHLHRRLACTVRQDRSLQESDGLDLPWVSPYGSDFNFDYRVSFTPEQIAAGEASYNYRRQPIDISEQVGISVFCRDQGEVFHSYSCYARGVDMLNGAYHYLDLVPKGRDEDGLDFTMEWVRRHDQY